MSATMPALLGSAAMLHLHMQVAADDCVRKHKPANMAMYGALKYLLLTVVAADNFAVLALPVDTEPRTVADAVSLMEPIKVSVSAPDHNSCRIWQGLCCPSAESALIISACAR